MAELKTKATEASVEDFLAGIEEEQVRTDSQKLLGLMAEMTGAKPKLWGTNIIGFGDYHYKYASGCEGDWFQMGFAPRKKHITLYIIEALENHQDLLSKLGKHTNGKSCLHLKRLSDADPDVLRELLMRSLQMHSG